MPPPPPRSGDEDGGTPLRHGLTHRRRSTRSGAPAGRQTNHEVYARPEVYDLAFSFRDEVHETDFLLDAAAFHGRARPARVLELGCGPARHCLELARKGLNVTGLDCSRPMLDYAARLAAEAGVAVNLVEGDMAAFDLGAGRFDLVCVMLGTLSHLVENDQVVSCFRSVHGHLAEDGLLVVELAHPAQVFNLMTAFEGEAWEAEGEAGERVLVEWGNEDDEFDPVSQVLTRTVTFGVFNAAGECVQEVNDLVLQRQFTVQEMKLLGAAAGLQLVGLYGDFDLAAPIATVRRRTSG